jgi:hypothetical protein
MSTPVRQGKRPALSHVTRNMLPGLSSLASLDGYAQAGDLP